MKYQKLPIAASYRRFRALAQKLRKMIADGSFSLLDSNKQLQLLQKMRMLFQQLRYTITPGKLKKVLASGALVAALGLGTLNAQNFGAPQINPFNLNASPDEDFGYFFPQLIDVDADGDYDILSIGNDYDDDYNNNPGFYYFENIGTPQAPNFAAPVANPFGLESATTITTIAYGDLDGDGDIDLLVGEYEDTEQVLYFENTGSANAPAFAAGVTNPFNIQAGDEFTVPFLVDMDNDGDLDFISTDYYESGSETGRYRYQENIGTNTTPNFANPVDNPFGLQQPESTFTTIIPFIADIDNDGDFDILSGGNYYFDLGEDEERTYLNFIENTGTAESPSFAIPVSEPFGIVFPEPSYISIPTMADLDDDGDLDLLSITYIYESENQPEGAFFVYHENQTVMSNVDDLSKEGPKLSVYPTITAGAINWQLEGYTSGEALQLSLYSLTGQLLKQEQTNNRYGTMHMDAYANGMYLLQIHTSDGQRIAEQKIVKQ